MYWGFAPVFFILPFKLLGISSDVFYTLFAGSLNTVLMYALLSEVARHFRIKLTQNALIALLVAFICASPNLYLSLNGRVWHTNQVISITYILSYLIFLFHYIRTSSIRSFVGALVFFNLACLTRLNLGLYGIILVFPIMQAYMRKKSVKRLLLASILVCGVFATTYFTYNYVRFGNVFEVGYRYHKGNERFMSAVAQNKILSSEYIEHNIRYYFLEPLQFSSQKPYININPEGNSIFFVYPYTLLVLAIPLLFKSIYKRMKKYQRFLYLLLLSTSLGLMAFLLLFYATGWVQFGNRYFFDLMPLVFIHLVILLPYVPKSLFYGTIGYGMIVNLLGAIAFYQYILP